MIHPWPFLMIVIATFAPVGDVPIGISAMQLEGSPFESPQDAAPKPPSSVRVLVLNELGETVPSATVAWRFLDPERVQASVHHDFAAANWTDSAPWSGRSRSDEQGLAIIPRPDRDLSLQLYGFTSERRSDGGRFISLLPLPDEVVPVVIEAPAQDFTDQKNAAAATLSLRRAPEDFAEGQRLFPTPFLVRCRVPSGERHRGPIVFNSQDHDPDTANCLIACSEDLLGCEFEVWREIDDGLDGELLEIFSGPTSAGETLEHCLAPIDPPTRISGRALDETGKARNDTRLFIEVLSRSEPSHDDHYEEDDDLDDADFVAVRTDRDGRFDLRLPLKLYVTLRDVRADDHLWRVTTQPPGLKRTRHRGARAFVPVALRSLEQSCIDLGDLRLIPFPVVASGWIVDEGGRPLSGVRVATWGRSHGFEMSWNSVEQDAQAITDAQGRFEIRGLEVQNWETSFSAWKPGFERRYLDNFRAWPSKKAIPMRRSRTRILRLLTPPLPKTTAISVFISDLLDPTLELERSQPLLRDWDYLAPNLYALRDAPHAGEVLFGPPGQEPWARSRLRSDQPPVETVDLRAAWKRAQKAKPGQQGETDR